MVSGLESFSGREEEEEGGGRESGALEGAARGLRSEAKEDEISDTALEGKGRCDRFA